MDALHPGIFVLQIWIESLGDNNERMHGSGKLLPEQLGILHVVCFENIHEDEICHIIRL